MNREIRDLFPAARNFTYLNSAAIGPMPTSTVAAVASQLNDVSNSGSLNLCKRLETRERVRSLVASMLGAKTTEIAFTRNTSDGLCAVASGLEWKSGDNIVTFENEFPANFYPWRTVRDRHGVEMRLCREINGRIDIDEFCSLIDERTRLVSVSAIQYHSGFRLDLERIGKAARNNDALFAVDIIQAFGAMPLDLPSQWVDIAAGASYKWLCSPEGCGIFYLNERALERVKPISMGWTAVRDPWNFDHREQAFLTDARAWETGMGGTALLAGLESSLQLLLSVGIQAISDHLMGLTDFLCEIIPHPQFEIVSSRLEGERSQIVCLRPKNGHSADEIATRLSSEGITVSSRAGLVRISPHFFNDLSDIERLASSLAEH